MDKLTKIPSLDSLESDNLIGKTIFIRVDFNVPMVPSAKGYRVLDDTRIRRFLDTTFRHIHKLTQGDCRIIIGSHLGRPHKRKDHQGWDGIFNIQYVCNHFDTLLRERYKDTYALFPPEVTDAHMTDSLGIIHKHQLPVGGIKFLPNLRYLLDPENTDNFREQFMQDVAQTSDVFINCAFGCSHRVSKSIKLLPQYMRQQGKIAVAGSLLKEEISRLGIFGKRVLAKPETTAVIAGGTKISDKIAILKTFVQARVKLIFIGGRMVNAFLLAKTQKNNLENLAIEQLPSKMWESKGEDDRKDLIREVQFAGEIILLAKKNKVMLIYPDDYKITKDFMETEYTIKEEPDFNEDFQLDLGPETIENYYLNILQEGAIENVFWNGPLGAYDHPQSDHYAEGSKQLAKILFAAAISDQKLSVVIGGGDSAAILNQLDCEELENLIRKQLLNQLNNQINREKLSIKLNSEDTYSIFNNFTSNFFVSTGGGASLEFLQKLLEDKCDSDIANYLPGTSILMDLKPETSQAA
ncbi:MAG: phosphoglycerate kinase [Candidatus Nitronauta litoralis]|uniref:Phosphoglycerate kinase n=1 Tax=Candidatus Nitronauta litoralis TaxID=2705533 RepID=A0A7T0BYY4_9BACT|nr:MAG: phosphoglycerate kinase [Candidatus Nitronauta litoralis]